MALRAPRTVSFAIRGPIARDDLRGLSDRVCALFARTVPDVAYCDVAEITPDAVTVDALARLQLAAGRLGCRVRLLNVSPELRQLLAFMGLSNVLPDDGYPG